MLRALFSILLICLISLPLFSADSEKFDIQAFKKSVSQRIQKRTLKNGIRVILMRQTQSPTIACYLKLGVGAANEPFDQAGVAHFLEHLLFKGTSVMGSRDYANEKIHLEHIETLGEKMDSLERQSQDPLLTPAQKKQIQSKIEKLTADLYSEQSKAQQFIISEEDSQAYSLAGQVGYNAYTSSDVTNYQIKLPAHRLAMWAELESNRFIDPVFREFYPERFVIKEERRMRYDSRPYAQLYELFLKTAFGFSPYGKPVIGFEKSMHRLRLRETREFYEKNYTPSRMVIAIVGDIQFDETFSLIEKFFGRLKSRPTAEFPPTEFEMPKGRRIAYLNAKNSPIMITGWARPNVLHEDDRSFEVLSRILGEGQTSRLIERLVKKEKIAVDIKIATSTPGEKLANQFTIFAEAYRSEDYAKIENAIAEELKNLREKGPTERELARIKSRYIAEFVHAISQNAGLADTLSYYEVMLHDYQKMFSALEEIESVTPEMIRKLVARYFIDTSNTTVYLQPS